MSSLLKACLLSAVVAGVAPASAQTVPSSNNNWYIGVQAGLLNNYGSYGGDLNFSSHIHPSFGILGGKWFNPWIGAQLQFNFGHNTGASNLANQLGPDYCYGFNTLSANLDAVVNLTRLFGGSAYQGRFNLDLIGGVGLVNTFGFNKQWWNEDGVVVTNEDGKTAIAMAHNTDGSSLFGYKFGLQGRYALSRTLELSLEVTNTFTGDQYDGYDLDGSNDGYINILVGLNYRIPTGEKAASNVKQRASREERNNAAALKRAQEWQKQQDEKKAAAQKAATAKAEAQKRKEVEAAEKAKAEVARKKAQEADRKAELEAQKAEQAARQKVRKAEQKTEDEVTAVAATKSETSNTYADNNANHYQFAIDFEGNSNTLSAAAKKIVADAAAQLLKLNNDDDLYITIRGQKAKNVDKFLQRAEAVRNELLNEHFIAAGRVFVERESAIVRSISSQTQCVIIYIAE